MTSVDLNCDMGESFGAWRLGADEEILPYVTSANIACGFHAGDPRVMRRTVEGALAAGVAVGAHPGFPDLVGFGRRDLDATPDEVHDLMVYQIGALMAFAAAAGTRVRHVKAHGALYNMAVEDAALAAAIADAVRDVDRSLVLFGLAGSTLLRAGEDAGLETASEAFADRNYMADGSLVSRRRADAMVHDADEVLARVVRMVTEGVVRTVDGRDIPIQADTVCVHGDGPNATLLARRLRRGLEEAGIAVRAGAPST